MNGPEWLQLLLSYGVQATLVISITWLLDLWSHSSQMKSRIWTACFLSLIGLLAAGLLLPRLQLLHPWSELEPGELLYVANAQFVIGRALLAIWLLGVAVMLLRWVWDFVRVIHFVRSCQMLSEADQRQLSNLVAPSLRSVSGRRVQFLRSSEELGPFCYQFHQPLVFLPESLVGGDPAELRHVLCHELTHLQTQHPMQLFLQRFLQTFLWFHPLVWMSGKRAALVREFVCDDAVTENGVATAAYLKTLLRVVERRTVPQNGTFAIGRSAAELRIRAQRLVKELGLKRPRPTFYSALMIPLLTLVVSQIWLPLNPLSPSNSIWSRWPSWTAATLYAFDVRVRDFDLHDPRYQIHELMEARDKDFDGALN